MGTTPQIPLEAAGVGVEFVAAGVAEEEELVVSKRRAWGLPAVLPAHSVLSSVRKGCISVVRFPALLRTLGPVRRGTPDVSKVTAKHAAAELLEAVVDELHGLLMLHPRGVKAD